MTRTRVSIVLVLFVVLGLSVAVAGEHVADQPGARTLELPREGLSVAVPADWDVEQYGDAVLALDKHGAYVRIRPYDGPAGRAPERTWTRLDEGGLRGAGLVARAGEIAFAVEADLPAGTEALRAEVDGILDSIDTTPYAHATRHVDWKRGWTLDLPEGWTRAVSPRGVARFERAKGASWLEVDDYHQASQTSPEQGASDADVPESWYERAWQTVLERLETEAGVVTKDPPMIETFTPIAGLETRRVTLGLDPNEGGEPTAWLTVFVAGPWRLAAFTRDAAVRAGVADAMRQFRPETKPGPRAPGAAEGTDVFAKGGPPVVFALPEGWEMREGSNQMRLAEWNLPGETGVQGVVYYFGAGGGGPIDQNLTRWKGQMGSAVEATMEVEELAEGVKAHWLDAVGAYSPGMGAGNPHAGTHGDFRMLAVVLEVPDGPLFVKLVGPKDVVGRHEEAFQAWVRSFRVAE